MKRKNAYCRQCGVIAIWDGITDFVEVEGSDDTETVLGM